MRPRRLPRALVVASLLLVGACGTGERPTLADEPIALPTPTTASSTTTTTTVPDTTHQVATSVADGAQEIFEAPDGAVKTTLPNPWVGTSPLVFLVKEDLGAWLEVYLPIRPNGSTGFVRKADVTVTSHEWSIVVSLSDFRLKVLKGTDVWLDAEIAVARDNTPTPGGLYYTTELLQPPDPNGPYGAYAYGLSGYSDTLQSFNNGPGQLGIHGTDQPELLGTQVSHGCIRMRNEDISLLAPVLPLGVPVLVFP